MTRDVRVGRILVAALQQAIAEELPARTEFYDHWLGPDGRHDGTLGRAPMTAVIGFLRTEGEAYRRVTERAGQLVAEWTSGDRSRVLRRWTLRMPRWWRARAVCRRIRVVAADTCPITRVRARVSKGAIEIAVEESVFCAVREVPPSPLCMFYAALIVEMFAADGLVVSGQMDHCRARPGAAGGGKERICGGTFALSSAS